MPRNGSGSYTPPSNTAYPAVNGVTLTAADYNALILDLAAAVTASLAADGQTPMTGNLNAGNNRITSLADSSSLSDAATASDVQTGRLSYLTSVSGTNTITASLTGLAAYTTGQIFSFVAAGANTTAPTLNINSIGAKSITKNGTTALVGGDIPAGAAVEVMYDGTQFQLLNAAMPASVGAPGYQKFPSGLILQWGSFVTSGTADVAVSFATSFASSVYAINLTYTNASGSGNVTTTVGSLTTAGFSAGAYVASSGARASASVYYIAIGK